MLYMYYMGIPAYLQSGWGNLVPSSIARANKPQTKKNGGGEAQCLIKIGENEKKKMCGIEN